MFKMNNNSGDNGLRKTTVNDYSKIIIPSEGNVKVNNTSSIRRDDCKRKIDSDVPVAQECSTNNFLKPDRSRYLDHLKKHIRVVSDDSDESDDDATQTSLHASMRPMNPAVLSGKPELTPILQNVVSTVNLSCDLNLKKITFSTRNSEYNPSRFSGVVMRIREPHTTALIFGSGKMVVTGAKTEGDALLAARKYARIIQKLGFNVKFLNFKIQNIVGTFDVKFPVRVENLHQKHGQFCRYEPELFPGLIYRMVKPRVVLLIFVNGKVVMTGAKCREDLQQALEVIVPVLESFKKE